MKKIFILCLYLFVSFTIYAWEDEIVFEKNGNVYAVGISRWFERLDRSVYDAYLMALKNYNMFHNIDVSTEYLEELQNGKHLSSTEKLSASSRNQLNTAKIVRRKTKKDIASGMFQTRILLQLKGPEEKSGYQPLSLYIHLHYSLDRCLFTENTIETDYGDLNSGSHLLRMKGHEVNSGAEYIGEIPFNLFLEECEYKILIADNQQYGPYQTDRFRPDGLHGDQLPSGLGRPREIF